CHRTLSVHLQAPFSGISVISIFRSAHSRDLVSLLRPARLDTGERLDVGLGPVPTKFRHRLR
ncbi:hypothetical protein CPB85DRAFT_1331845, partial [Mucidula mucida]